MTQASILPSVVKSAIVIEKTLIWLTPQNKREACWNSTVAASIGIQNNMQGSKIIGKKHKIHQFGIQTHDNRSASALDCSLLVPQVKNHFSSFELGFLNIEPKLVA